MLYDADKVEEAASVENEKDLYHSQLDVFLDPNDPEIAKLAKEQGIPAEWIEARRSPIYKMIIDWKIALPLHPEYRTAPMVWYIPPLSPIMNLFEGKGDRQTAEAIFPAIDQMRIPIDYLAQLLTAGDTDHIRSTLKKMSVMRQYMRAVQTNKSIDPALVSSVGLTEQQIEDMYRPLAIAKYDDRFVIGDHREEVSDLYAEQGRRGLSFSGGPGSCF